MAYTIQGKTLWLRAHNFSFKKPAARHANTDPTKQEALYSTVMTTPPEDELILFVDGVHVTMATKITCQAPS
ncbi:winged helix-turn-helix domain-containing protein [Holospora elegans]|uniref:winged helix-turn-helix domain-containing protein n=1 Tax=Holospora elegans TaxID=431043 RepID=UPI000A017EF6